MSLKKHINKKEDKYSIGSKNKLKAAIRHKIKRTFVGCLDAIEKELGLPSDKTHEKMFKRLRSKILNIGNDQIRNIEIELERYNIEFIPYHIEFVSIERKQELDNEKGKDS